jgi:hypothetical protein
MCTRTCSRGRQAMASRSTPGLRDRDELDASAERVRRGIGALGQGPYPAEKPRASATAQGRMSG